MSQTLTTPTITAAVADADPPEQYSRNVKQQLQNKPTIDTNDARAAAAQNVTSEAAGAEGRPEEAAAAGKAKTPEDLQKLLQTKIDKMKATNDSITNEFSDLKSATPATPDNKWNDFGSKVDTAKLELDAAIKALIEYKHASTGANLANEFETADRTGNFTGGSSSTKSKSKKKHRSYKSYHPEIGKTRKHHSHDDHKRVSFVHQA
jgi:hypothetical protein